MQFTQKKNEDDKGDKMNEIIEDYKDIIKLY